MAHANIVHSIHDMLSNYVVHIDFEAVIAGDQYFLYVALRLQKMEM